MEKAKLTIYGRLSGLNEYTNACRTNKYAGAKLKQENQRIIAEHIAVQLKGVHFEKPVHIDFAWYEKEKRRDLDNIAFAKKFIQDTLTECGVLNGDGWQHISSFSDSFYIDKENPRIEVFIND